MKVQSRLKIGITTKMWIPKELNIRTMATCLPCINKMEVIRHTLLVVVAARTSITKVMDNSTICSNRTTTVTHIRASPLSSSTRGTTSTSTITIWDLSLRTTTTMLTIVVVGINRTRSSRILCSLESLRVSYLSWSFTTLNCLVCALIKTSNCILRCWRNSPRSSPTLSS